MVDAYQGRETVGQIATRLGLHRNTVSAALEREEWLGATTSAEQSTSTKPTNSTPPACP